MSFASEKMPVLLLQQSQQTVKTKYLFRNAEGT